jgi:uroporphyrinogen-III synthase
MTPPNTDLAPTLAGRVVAVPESRQLDVLAGLLERRGATVLRCPLVAIRDTPQTEPVLAWLHRRLKPNRTELIIFYTGEGIERLLGFARRAGLETEFAAALGEAQILTRGPKPKRALRKLGLAPTLEAPEPTTDGLIACLETLDLAGRRVAVQLYSALDRPRLLDYLRSRGVEPDCVAPYVYASAAEDLEVVGLIERLQRGNVDIIAFTSKAQVERLRRIARERGLEDALAYGLARTQIAAIGPVVAAELAAAHLSVAAMPEPENGFSMKPLVTSICALAESASR